MYRLRMAVALAVTSFLQRKLEDKNGTRTYRFYRNIANKFKENGAVLKVYRVVSSFSLIPAIKEPSIHSYCMSPLAFRFKPPVAVLPSSFSRFQSISWSLYCTRSVVSPIPSLLFPSRATESDETFDSCGGFNTFGALRRNKRY